MWVNRPWWGRKDEEKIGDLNFSSNVRDYGRKTRWQILKLKCHHPHFPIPSPISLTLSTKNPETILVESRTGFASCPKPLCNMATMMVGKSCSNTLLLVRCVCTICGHRVCLESLVVTRNPRPVANVPSVRVASLFKEKKWVRKRQGDPQKGII